MIYFLAEQYSGSIYLQEDYAGFNSIVIPYLYTITRIPIMENIYRSLECRTKDSAKQEFYRSLIVFDPQIILFRK